MLNRAHAGSGFNCPLCGADKYAPVTITLKDGSTRQAGFFQCLGCSLHFTDPARFSDVLDDAPADPGVGAGKARKPRDQADG